MRLTANFSSETMKIRRLWEDIFKVLKEKGISTENSISSKTILQKIRDNSRHSKINKTENSSLADLIYKKNYCKSFRLKWKSNRSNSDPHVQINSTNKSNYAGKYKDNKNVFLLVILLFLSDLKDILIKQ